MRKFLPVLLFLLCSKLVRTQTVSPDYVDGQIYVKLTGASLRPVLHEDPRNIPAAKLKTLSAILSGYAVTKLSRPFYQADDDANLAAILKICFSKKALVNSLISDLEKTDAIVYAEKVPLMRTDVVPNDPSFPQHLTQINAPAAWNIFNGNSNVPVAVVDDAVMWNHIDLQSNIYINPGEIAGNNIDDDNNGYIDDIHGWDASDLDNDPAPTNTLMIHGTHCSGIAGASTDNSIGVASIGWNIKIIPVKCQTDAGSTTGIANGYEGIIYAVRAHARVISCSWGGSNSITGQSVIDYAWSRGALIIASAGNSGNSTPTYPAAYTNVYSVASVDNNDVGSGFSNFGSWVDIAAPGEGVISTVPYVGTPAYLQLSGTSMAAPVVAGLAGLMLSKCPLLTASDIIHCISSTAANIYSLSANSSYAGNLLGAGRIDAFQAMTCAAGFLSYPPLANFFAFPASSCTNTPVQFSDSSLYAPTSWLWTFQNGTPATSTLSNPVVQWSVPGTYSVSLTASNANGSNTKTRLSYITIVTPNSFPQLTEGFESAAFLPAGWIPKNIGNDMIYWEHKTNIGAYGTSNSSAVFDNFSYNVAGDRDEMISPRLGFSNVAEAKLKFDVAYARYDAVDSDTLEVKLSTDCGTSWSTIYLKGGTTLATAPDASNQFVPTHSQWRTDSVDISSVTAGQGSVMFSFINHGQYGQPIYLDNINLSYQTPTVEITAPDNSCVGVPVTFTNQSLLAGSYSWNIPGGTPAVSSIANPTVTYPAPGIYTIDVSVSNGTETTVYTMNLSVAAAPVISLTAENSSCGSCSDGSVQAQVTGGTGTLSYNWAPSGGNSPDAAGLGAGCYTLSVTDAAACTVTASACVDFYTGIHSQSITSEDLIVYPNPTEDAITIELKNTSYSYQIYSSTGQTILRGTGDGKYMIHLAAYPAGIYLLEVKSENALLLKKIIKN